MSYTFETKLFGLTVEVEGVFDTGENPSLDCEGYPPSFEIETIQHKGDDIEVCDLPEEELEDIEQAAFVDASNNYDPY